MDFLILVKCYVIFLIMPFCYVEREAEILKPISSVEVYEKESASFETAISEEDVTGEWKLRGQVLTRSPVRILQVLTLSPERLSVYMNMCICLYFNIIKYENLVILTVLLLIFF